MYLDFRIFILFSISLLLVSCSNTPSAIKPFSSDGCSLFPDSSLINNEDWTRCCIEHDIRYWMGGTFEQRKSADLALKQCVYAETQDSTFANLMYQGVRAGGSPYFYNWYRWGYGWSYERQYQTLTPEELDRVKQLLIEYRAQKNSI